MGQSDHFPLCQVDSVTTGEPMGANNSIPKRQFNTVASAAAIKLSTVIAEAMGGDISRLFFTELEIHEVCSGLFRTRCRFQWHARCMEMCDSHWRYVDLLIFDRLGDHRTKNFEIVGAAQWNWSRSDFEHTPESVPVKLLPQGFPFVQQTEPIVGEVVVIGTPSIPPNRPKPHFVSARKFGADNEFRAGEKVLHRCEFTDLASYVAAQRSAHTVASYFRDNCDSVEAAEEATKIAAIYFQLFGKALEVSH